MCLSKMKFFYLFLANLFLLHAAMAVERLNYGWDSKGNCLKITPTGEYIEDHNTYPPQYCTHRLNFGFDKTGACRKLTPKGEFVEDHTTYPNQTCGI
jgi:hypothetical protein